MAARCDLRDPGGEDPGFPQRGLLLLHLLMAILFLFDVDFACQMACADDGT